MDFLEHLEDRQEELIEQFIAHAVLVALAIGIATAIGVTLGVLAYRTQRPRELLLATTGAILTIPSIALFGVFINWGMGFGTTPVLVGLVMYALLPIVRNTIVGLREVDPAVVESAQGMGMGRAQRLVRIELPLAWPVILTGMRVSTLILLGIAAIGAYVNGPGLGNDIFDGLAAIGTSQSTNLVLGGMLGILILAIVFDLFYIVVNRLTTSRGLR